MAVQELDPVQRAFVNETVRPFLEDMVRIATRIDLFVLDYENQQNSIAETADDLGDGLDGTAPRTDAPVLTGTLLASIKANAEAMRAELSEAEYGVLVSLLVRDLSTILGR